jgi:hypothetical protein
MADPFPTPYESLLADDALLGAALAAARTETQALFPDQTLPPISVVSVRQQASVFTFKHAGSQSAGMFFSGSLPKIAAMYAAFELRRAVNLLVVNPLPSSSAAAHDNLRAAFDDVIDVASPIISAAPAVNRQMRIPKYEQIFAAIPLIDGGFSFEFNLEFSTHLRKMIVESDNGSAGECVKRLGYSWINGALQKGGFFSLPSKAGLWLAGTYGGGWPAVRVPSLNDGDTAQGTTCFDAANLYAHLLQGTLGRPLIDSSGKMLDLLVQAASVDPAFIDWERRGLTARRYHVTHTKIGIGPRTAGDVLSEATILEHSATGDVFIVVLQNLPRTTQGMEMAATLVDLTTDHFLFAV